MLLSSLLGNAVAQLRTAMYKRYINSIIIIIIIIIINL